ncbi:hypothetical protein CHU98_g560 [Xylaria longipes]|nr:hypothetical protein CHU98_g560 [Xylaria longipes]
MSRTVLLELLQLPFIITASSCTRDRLRKTLTSEAKKIELMIAPPRGMLRWDLDFRGGGGQLKRIITHVHHPVAGFFANNDSRPSMAQQVDVGMDFLLWLTGNPFDPLVCTQAYHGGRPKIGMRAPLPELNAYAKRERDKNRVLDLSEYTPSFLSLLQRFTQRDLTEAAAKGDSVAEIAIKTLTRLKNQ